MIPYWASFAGTMHGLFFFPFPFPVPPSPPQPPHLQDQLGHSTRHERLRKNIIVDGNYQLVELGRAHGHDAHPRRSWGRGGRRRRRRQRLRPPSRSTPSHPKCARISTHRSLRQIMVIALIIQLFSHRLVRSPPPQLPRKEISSLSDPVRREPEPCPTP